jgi:hypothetical protein
MKIFRVPKKHYIGQGQRIEIKVKRIQNSMRIESPFQGYGGERALSQANQRLRPVGA